MPIIKSAIKKLRSDKKKEGFNRSVKTKALNLISGFRKKPESGQISQLFSSIDKAAKRGVFHTKKADRLKSRLAKMLDLKK